MAPMMHAHDDELVTRGPTFEPETAFVACFDVGYVAYCAKKPGVVFATLRGRPNKLLGGSGRLRASSRLGCLLGCIGHPKPAQAAQDLAHVAYVLKDATLHILMLAAVPKYKGRGAGGTLVGMLMASHKDAARRVVGHAMDGSLPFWKKLSFRVAAARVREALVAPEDEAGNERLPLVYRSIV